MTIRISLDKPVGFVTNAGVAAVGPTTVSRPARLPWGGIGWSLQLPLSTIGTYMQAIGILHAVGTPSRRSAPASRTGPLRTQGSRWYPKMFALWVILTFARATVLRDTGGAIYPERWSSRSVRQRAEPPPRRNA